VADFKKLLTSALNQNNIQIDDIAQQKLAHYLDLMLTWNKVFNLTSITNPKEMVYLHIIDSLAIQPFLHGNKLLDVGSGAGLPGIPLAIINPDQHWTLLDKNNKKTRFMTQAVAELGLTNVTVIHSRTEDFKPAQCFDSILSRAFGTLHMFTETTAHLLCSDGIWLAMKGKYPDDELADIADRCKIQKIARLDLKGITIERHIVCLQTKSHGE
jgi:16S rRNA (guanine527-N7)-methyltransferase